MIKDWKIEPEGGGLWKAEIIADVKSIYEIESALMPLDKYHFLWKDFADEYPERKNYRKEPFDDGYAEWVESDVVLCYGKLKHGDKFIKGCVLARFVQDINDGIEKEYWMVEDNYHFDLEECYLWMYLPKAGEEAEDDRDD